MNQKNVQLFEITNSFELYHLSSLISYIRFALFDGDTVDLTLASKLAPDGVFKGTNLPPKTLALEKEVWKTLCRIAISKLYKLQNNDQGIEQPANTNQQLCIAILDQERIVWKYIIDVGCIIVPFMDMSKKEA